MKSKILERSISIGILIVTTAICLVVFELFLRRVYGYGYLDKPFMFRKFYQYDSEIGRVVSPNREGMYRTAEGDRYYYVKTNSDGFRGDEIEDRHTPKIAVLGDSFIFGYGVDQDNMFSTVLNEFTDGRVINLGNSGTSVDQMYLLLKWYIPTFIFSDVIVYISPSEAFLKTFTYEEFTKNFPKQAHVSPSVNKRQQSAPRSAKIEIIEWILQQFLELYREKGFRFHVIYDRLHQDEEEYLQSTYCQKQSCLSFRQYQEEFLRKYSEYTLTCPGNPHWNEIGHRLFAYVLYRNLFEDEVDKQ